MNPFFALVFACFGVTISEGYMLATLFKSAARQPEIIKDLRSLLILGIAFIEGTFFVTLAMAFVLK